MDRMRLNKNQRKEGKETRRKRSGKVQKDELCVEGQKMRRINGGFVS